MVPLALLALVRNPLAAAVVVVVTLVHAARNVLDNADAGTFHIPVPPRALVALMLVTVLLVYAWAGRHARCPPPRDGLPTRC
jgi:hypothetical protein